MSRVPLQNILQMRHVAWKRSGQAHFDVLRTLTQERLSLAAS